jgi:hypothetical protein
MLRDNYQARIYSPASGDTNFDRQSRYYNGNGVGRKNIAIADGKITVDGLGSYPVDDVTAAPDMYELHYNEDPYHIESKYSPAKMPANGSSMVPRVFKTNVGDIFTTNTINGTVDEIKVGVMLAPGANGILEVVANDAEGMKWQVVKVYTMPDHQRGVKIMRIA